MQYSFVFKATFTAKRTTATIYIYGENAGESYIVFNSTASNNISKYVWKLNYTNVFYISN